MDGQPSLVYGAEILLGSAPARARLEPLGRGALGESERGFARGLAGFTSALGLLARIEASYLAEPAP